MSTSDMRTLLDEATRELPADVARAPLGEIRHRVRRRRARRTITVAAVAALVAAGLVPLLRGVPQPAPDPAVSRPPANSLPWSFAYRDGEQVRLYLHRQDCQVLDAPVVAVEPQGNTAVVTVTGTLRRPDDCTRAGIPMVELPPHSVGAGQILVDPVTGRRPPVYDRAHLPVAWRGLELNGYGAISRDAGPETFTVSYMTRKPKNLEVVTSQVDIVGTDPAKATQGGVPLRVGPVDGVLYDVLGEYRFLWRVPAPGGELGYEVTPVRLRLSRAEFIALLDGFTWR
ncbi:hypothetical protein ACFQY4_30340 [Catellatospora bangladeshensis]|uniref:Uncharacterized protein n=1 Tax=Catellatospora bangladeshensis TaxID=310355 RepID=A0A8J3JDU7_9ACTN|nr:hypothetical protein [Catellatospora bangladeshensis]GIF80819.1 hypothetical protein Cba03nite_21680 [Catellatospora bangladeshensis]